MAKVGVLTDCNTAEASDARATGGPREALAGDGLPLVAMAGAVCGAIGGAVLGFDAGGFYPTLCGAFGTLLGCALATVGWHLVD